jgi:uncharacterized glyoxalase superfamily protein PhnB
MPNVNPIPQGCHTVNVFLTVKDAAKAIEWYGKAFGAKETFRMPGPGGKIMHAEMQIGDSVLMLADEMPEMGCVGPETLKGSAVTVMMYFDNVDKIWDQATKAGGTVTMPLADMFWGDRYGQFTDPFGHKWAIAQHIEDVSHEQMKVRGEEFMKKQMAGARK